MSENLIQTTSVEPVLHIASVVVHAHPNALVNVKNWLSVFPGAEIHAEDVRGKLVVVVEAESENGILNLLDGLCAQTGVLNAALVYHEIIHGHEIIPGNDIIPGREILTGPAILTGELPTL
jgi:periplasmic nitrate reductase NapD